MLIDYYGIYQKYEFPGWDKSLEIVNKQERLNFLEHEMLMNIDDEFRHRFIPYMQLHEFEGLLFNDINIFFQQFNSNEIVGSEELHEVFTNYSDPEMINNGRDTAPSKRLERIIKGYNKVVYGNILAEAIGLSNIRTKCHRFDHWVHSIEFL